MEPHTQTDLHTEESMMVTDADIAAAVDRMRRADDRGWAEFNVDIITAYERTLGLLAKLSHRHEWQPMAGPCICEAHNETRKALKEAGRDG